MPNLNRRGPKGEGAMTGRRMGRCNPENRGKSDDEILNQPFVETETNGNNSNFRQGSGWHHGRGMGFGRQMGAGKRNHRNQDTSKSE